MDDLFDKVTKIQRELDEGQDLKWNEIWNLKLKVGLSERGDSSESDNEASEEESDAESDEDQDS